MTAKGEKIRSHLIAEYGSKEKGEQVFYASKNAGTISGIDSDRTAHLHGRNIDDVFAKMESLFGRMDAYGARADKLR